MKTESRVRFCKLGRTYHLRIEKAVDLIHILHVNEALWLATSAPIAAFRLDHAFLSYLDIDNDGRVHASELKASIEELFQSLKDYEAIDERRGELLLNSLSDNSYGYALQESINKMRIRQGLHSEKEITLDQVRKVKAEINLYPISEGGVVLPEAAEDQKICQFIRDVLQTVGGAPHPSGKHGVTCVEIERFLAKAKAFLEWEERGALSQQQQRSDILPLGADTAEAYKLFQKLRDKIEQYFFQCEAVDFDESILTRMPPTEEDLKSTDFKQPEAIEELLSKSPLSQPRSDGVLDLKEEVNPCYRDRIDDLRKKVLEPLLNCTMHELTHEQWQKVKVLFQPYESWLNSNPQPEMDNMDRETLRDYINGDYMQSVKDLVGRGSETAIELDKVRAVERLILFQMNILDFANNFVSFPDLYDPGERALFEMGSLVMDGRRFNMAVKVEDRPEHVKVAESGSTFIMYVQVAHKQNTEPYEVAVPVTSGGKGNIVVGKRGIFQDIEHRESDARVVQIIENPISLREAAWTPFRRIGELITGKIEQITTSAGKKLEMTTQQGMTLAGTAATTPPPAPAAPQPQTQPEIERRGILNGGILAGGGLAIAALGSSLAYISKVVANQGIWLLVWGLVGALVAVLLPTLILAFLKLRRRDLSAILEGSGWAINARMKLTHIQSIYFTRRPSYPKGSGVKTGISWLFIIILIVLLGFLVWSAYYWMLQQIQ